MGLTWCFAQSPLSDLIFTVGTTARDGGGNDWSYLLIGTPSSELLAGKRFAVFGKEGDAASANTFSQRGTMAQQADTTSINLLLNQSTALGQNLAMLGESLNLLLRNVTGISNQPLATKVLTAFQVAKTNSRTATFLEQMEKGNPALSLCLGHAFAEQITTITTYELRELHPVTGAPGDVIGRTTVAPGSPIVLPAPGRPFHANTAELRDDLLIRLRWASPDSLRRLSLASHGFNVWRIGYTQAIAGNFHKTPPTVAQLYGNPNFTRANEAPVQATFLSDAEAYNGLEMATYLFADDNGRLRGNPPFVDGERFFYFITARDILGRDGLVSKGSAIQACRRKPPQAPARLTVRDEPLTDAAGNVLQRFRIAWPQNTNTNDAVTHYWIYRWPDPSLAFTNDLIPLSNRVGIVQQLAATNLNSFLDTNVNAPTNPGPSVFWYTVRSVYEGVCAPVFSPHSAPISGVLRERTGPDAPSGGVFGSCGAPAVIFSNFTRVAVSDLEEGRWHYRFSCVRRDPAIAWIEFSVTNAQGAVESIGPIFFEADEDRLDTEYSVPDSTLVTGVACVVGRANEQASRPASYRITSANVAGQRADVHFFAGTVLVTAAEGTDPLLAAINVDYGGGQCLPASNVQIDPSGTVTMQFNLPSRPALVQGSTNNGASWYDIGTAFPESNSFFSVSYPACLTGPVPQFRACVIDLASDGNCLDHLSRASGDGPVAPIVVHFTPPPRTREYRVYRQTDGGPMSLISQGNTRYDPLRAARRIVVRDDVMPSTSARFCYYVQVFDENGNPSPTTQLGCREGPPPALPRPVLAEPAPAGTVAQPQVILNWFCPTAGVDRFRFLIKRVDKKPDVVPDSAPSAIGFTSPGLLVRSRTTLYSRSVLRTRLRRSVYTSFAGASAVTSVTVDEGQLTPTLPSGFGPGPQFTLTANILANVPYQITVQALNARGDAGPISEMWEFTWRPPTVLANVPWPARALPRVEDFDSSLPNPAPPYAPRVRAVLFTNDLIFITPFPDRRFPIGIRIGEISGSLEPESNLGNNGFIRYFANEGTAHPDPNRGIFRRFSGGASRGEILLPIVVYRQQVSNAFFPRVTGDLIQVTPLIERIPWKHVGSGHYEIPDRMITFRTETFPGGSRHLLYLRDQQPVHLRARYRYFVVRFKTNHEIDQIIPAGELEVPRETCDGCD